MVRNAGTSIRGVAAVAAAAAAGMAAGMAAITGLQRSPAVIVEVAVRTSHGLFCSSLYEW